MALNDTKASANAVYNAVKGALGLFADINKTTGVEEDPSPSLVDEYESTLSNEKIIALTKEWKKNYDKYYEDVEPSQEKSFSYWIGRHKLDANQKQGDSRDLIDNQIFNAIETFLPIASRANPDPLVQADPSEYSQKLAGWIKNALVYEADRQKLRRKLAKVLRHWLIYRIGVLKLVWDAKTSRIKTEIINPKRMIFDVDGYVDEGGHFIGRYLGEKKRIVAEDLATMFPKRRNEIAKECLDKWGSIIEYIEWWYSNTDVFFTMKDVVLGKFKNPHWNYNGKVTEKDPETGEEVEQEVQGKNHFVSMLSPYLFLSIFSTGLQPHDETSLVLQNIGIQDMINRRWNQIDDNVKSMNNGMVVSGEYFTEEQASQAATALRKGMAIRVPTGDVNRAVMRMAAPPIPSQVYDMMKDGRNELQNIFGTAGSTPSGQKETETVRGKILINQLDSSRIGGGITEYLEQLADSVYNWWVQMMFVYWTDEHYFTSMGIENGAEFIVLKNTMFSSLKTLDITVKEGTLIPKDPMTQRNEAMDLWSAGAIDPKSLFAKLGFGDPSESAKQLILWQMVQKGALPPEAYLPNFSIPAQTQLPEQGVGGPAVNPLGPPEQPTIPPTGTQTGEQAQSQQLLQSVPIR